MRARLEDAGKIPVERYIEARRNVDEVRRTIQAVFERVDLLALRPTTPLLPETIKDVLENKSPTSPSRLRNVRLMNVYGVPALSLPCGFSRSGLPIGLEIAGPPLREADLLALGHHFEAATDSCNRHLYCDSGEDT